MDDVVLYDGLKTGDSKVIESIYDICFPIVKHWVLRNSGSEADAYDVFQEALETILLKLDKSHDNLESLIIIISKRRWIDRLRKNKSTEKVRNEIVERYHIDEEDSNVLIQEERAYLRSTILEKSFERLSSICQQVMTMIKLGKKVEEIVIQLSFSSANTLYRRKAACMERWSMLVKQDPEYKSYFE